MNLLAGADDGDGDALEKWRAALRGMLTARLGPLPESVIQKIESSNLAQLDAALEQALQVRRLGDLRF